MCDKKQTAAEYVYIINNCWLDTKTQLVPEALAKSSANLIIYLKYVLDNYGLNV